MQMVSRSFVVAVRRHGVTQDYKQPCRVPLSFLITIRILDATRIHKNNFTGSGALFFSIAEHKRCVPSVQSRLGLPNIPLRSRTCPRQEAAASRCFTYPAISPSDRPSIRAAKTIRFAWFRTAVANLSGYRKATQTLCPLSNNYSTREHPVIPVAATTNVLAKRLSFSLLLKLIIIFK